MVYETHRNHNHHHPQRVLQGIAWWCPCSSTYMDGKIMKCKRNSANVRPKSIICMGALCEWKCHKQITIVIKLDKGWKKSGTQQTFSKYDILTYNWSKWLGTIKKHNILNSRLLLQLKCSLQIKQRFKCKHIIQCL